MQGLLGQSQVQGQQLVCTRNKPTRPRFQPCRAERSRQGPALLSSSAAPVLGGPLVDVLSSKIRHDLELVRDTTGVDLEEAHNKVVALLNPVAGEAMQRSLEVQIAGLQHELAQAHQEVHLSEARLDRTLDDLSQLQASVSHVRLPSNASMAAASTSAPATPVPAPARQQGAQGKPSGQHRRSGLASTLELPQGLRDFWYPVAFSAKLAPGLMVPLELLDEKWVVFRGADGIPACIRDECAHRACPLSLGTVVDGQIQCAYHGWQFDGSGACTKMPSTRFCRGVGVSSLPVREENGFVWVWPGGDSSTTSDSAAAPELPASAAPPEGFMVHAELELEVPVEHGLLLENLLDLAHAPFTHTSTFAKGWPVPEVVKFHAARLLGGNWEPYPIDMSFEPPCMVLSSIGLAQPGKIERGARAADCRNHLHQLHVCVPVSAMRTRLLYRMSMDFLGWTKHVPGIIHFWAHIAGQVMGEDLVLVAGQQDRMQRGADTWANPVSYDKLGVRYRRWRNSLSLPAGARDAAAAELKRPMSAGDIFRAEEEEEEDEGLMCVAAWEE